MTPAARLQAAIELVAAVEEQLDGGLPADRVSRRFFAARRYAGAKDRAAISEILYAVLRRRAEFAWRLVAAGAEAGATGVPAPRLLVLAERIVAGGLTPATLASLCDGSRHAPTPLDDREVEIASCLVRGLDQGPDGAARGNYPAWLEAELRRRFDASLDVEMAALSLRAPLDLRVNTLLANRETAMAALAAEGVEASFTPLSPCGLRVAGRFNAAMSACFRKGWLEIQDEGSQLVALMAEVRPGMQVVDFCAGGGGKSLAMAAAMEGRGQIHALDIDPRRLEKIGPRLQRARARNVQTRPILPEHDPWLEQSAASFDRVLVDAPCSGSGTWRRNPDLKWRLQPDGLADLQQTQALVLAAAAPLVRPGGRLVYATCSLLPCENEVQVTDFLACHGGFRVRPVAEVWASVLGTPCPATGPFLALSPGSHGTDGFFAAVLECGE